MEQNNIDIAALLKDCPKGTKLYSPICGECEYDGITELGYISVLYDNQESGWDFDKYGYLCDDTEHKGECLLFPSKEVRDWGCFKVKYVKGGDGITEGEKVHKLLLANGGTELEDGTWDCSDPSAIYYIDAITHTIKRTNTVSERVYIFSTGTELKLEEKQPKFKVGDVVVKQYIEKDRIGVVTVVCANGVYVDWRNETTIELFDDLLSAQDGEIAKWNKEVLEPNHLHYSTSKREIIHWFLPFDKIVERCVDDDNIGEWSAGLFSHYDKENHPCYPYVTVAGMCNECLPYNKNTAKLIGTNDDYKEDE